MPRTLILEPTRELAAQVAEAFREYGAKHKLNVALLIGGVSFGDQDTKLMRGVDVLIATPGRLLDHLERGKLLLTGVEMLVIDEADRMLDMGFIPDIERICKLVPFTRQTLFFTATMPPEIQRIADTVPAQPGARRGFPPRHHRAAITPALVACGREPQAEARHAAQLIRSADELKNAIVFCNRKSEVAMLHRSLKRHGFNAVALHGDMDQPARMAALEAFRNGEVKLLIASDVAARGLDIPEVSHMFNFDVPHHADDYVHRIGRTGRAGRTGTAITIVAPMDQKRSRRSKSLPARPFPGQANSPPAAPTSTKRVNTSRAAASVGAAASRRRSQNRPPGRLRSPVSKRHVRADRRSRNTGAIEEGGDSSHLPAFLLRPVRVKA